MYPLQNLFWKHPLYVHPQISSFVRGFILSYVKESQRDILLVEFYLSGIFDVEIIKVLYAESKISDLY